MSTLSGFVQCRHTWLIQVVRCHAHVVTVTIGSVTSWCDCGFVEQPSCSKQILPVILRSDRQVHCCRGLVHARAEQSPWCVVNRLAGWFEALGLKPATHGDEGAVNARRCLLLLGHKNVNTYTWESVRSG